MATLGERAEAMLRRVLRTAGRLGLDQESVARLEAAFRLGMEPRSERRLDDHHPDFLHPSRTALILMDDCGVATPLPLATALVAESRDPGLVPAPERVASLGAGVEGVLAELAGLQVAGDRVLETLVALSDDARLVALAERLDHARHLHLRDPGEWRPYHRVTCQAYAPVASRTHQALEARLVWWCETFDRRFLGAERA